jgi:peptidylprolyl isomerase
VTCAAQVSLEPRQGYGEWKEELVVRIPLTEAPGDYVAGQAVQLSNGQVAKVTDVTEEHVVIDANHQLAGKVGQGGYVRRA